MPTAIVMTTKADVPNANGHIYPRAVVEKIATELNGKAWPITYGYPDPEHPEFHESKGRTVPGTAKMLPDGQLVVEVDMDDKVVEEQLRIGDLKLGGGYMADVVPSVNPEQVVVVPPGDKPMLVHVAAFRE